MRADAHDIDVPKPALWGAAALIVLSIALAANARRDRPQTGADVEAVGAWIAFEDRPDGSVAVFDAERGREIGVLPVGQQGFVRGVMRGMFRERKLSAMDRDARFRLARTRDGRLVLDDPDSGRHVDLDSFGPTNSRAFAVFLDEARGGQ
ncbi:MAG: hypothetical protein JNL21_21535 [Myxococcales bacterium]|nr:hypothetical protein [Myxococcales bacterium]